SGAYSMIGAQTCNKWSYFIYGQFAWPFINAAGGRFMPDVPLEGWADTPPDRETKFWFGWLWWGVTSTMLTTWGEDIIPGLLWGSGTSLGTATNVVSPPIIGVSVIPIFPGGQPDGLLGTLLPAGLPVILPNPNPAQEGLGNLIGAGIIIIDIGLGGKI